ncbi:copper-translocating P-type ATPase [Phaeocystidibacter marisrubri]|uniref:Copper-translocating P-type ATPase n=1 Tax=Phaeocystidibacter marisrubri TaxID=1577780 RepID=A0A6L3ZDA4_9FLAO|nr:copper-translocating P-type ATPase [Phaeocystidibacter marisrubri]KAB2815833.1 copper-translocating P-type ATPase [Phaeocystidibacter marisrubri]
MNHSEQHMSEKEEHSQHNSGQHKHQNHNDHHRMMIEDFKKRFWVSTALSIPILILSPMIQSFLGVEWTFEGRLYVLWALSTFIFIYGGWPFLKGLKDELKSSGPGMMTLIALAITVAYLYSSVVVFGLEGKLFFWELATLIDVMLVGHWVEMKSILGASNALEKLVEMMPSEAHLKKGDEFVDVPLSEVNSDDILLIKPGESIPADGVITSGESHLNESMLTGESKPVKKGVDDEVVGGSINGNNSIEISVKHTGEDSYLNKVIQLVREAQESKSKTQNLANKAAKWLAYVALSAGAITLAVWLSLGYDFAFSMERMVTVMVISCPHALGLAIPLVVAISTSKSANNGLLIRNRAAFESSRKINAIVFDKTGTLTKGDFGVVSFASTHSNTSDEEILKLAAAVEKHSEHPIATGILKTASERNLSLPESSDFEAITGKGAKAKVKDHWISVVSPGYLNENNITLPEREDASDDQTVVYVLQGDDLLGYIALADEIRPEAEGAIRKFKREGIAVYMATGDNERVARTVSDKLDLDGYYAEVLPDEKVKVVEDLQNDGKFVAMTGDGVNDAPALANADVGIAVGSGTDIAAETADIILVNSDPNDIFKLIQFGRATYKKMIQNLIWATAYNAFAIPLAAGVLYSTGFMLSPAVGAIFMSLSTVIVAVNAQLLKLEGT